MEKILFHTLSHGGGKIFEASARDFCNDPQILLKKELIKRNIEYDTSDDHSLENCRWIVFADVISTYQGTKGKIRRLKRKIIGKPSRDLFQECIKKGMQDKMVLFLSEPSSVFPENWNPKWHTVFPVIFTWNDKLVDGKKYFKTPAVPLPENYPKIPKVRFSQKKLLVNISMNKTSSCAKELYSERESAIAFFERRHPLNFDLYGIGWNKSQNWVQKYLFRKVNFHPSFRGSITHKWEVLPNYRFSLCYENIHGELGYITEKIFDCMRCSCVPIYWGADNIGDYVDKGAFIDRREFSSNIELEKYIVSIMESEYCGYLDAMCSYLKSQRFKFFLSSEWIDTILKTLNLKKLLND
jgi:hypothetical protein